MGLDGFEVGCRRSTHFSIGQLEQEEENYSQFMFHERSLSIYPSPSLVVVFPSSVLIARRGLSLDVL